MGGILIQGIVKQIPNQSLSDCEIAPTLGRLGEQLVSQLGGKYFTQNYNGNLFYGSTTNAGVAIPADNATSQVFGLWNPAGSGKLCVPVHFRAGIVTLGTRVVSSIHFNFLPNAGSAIGAAGAPISAFTETSAQSGIVGGSSHKNTTRFTLSATTIAMTNFWFTGLFHDLATGGAPPAFVTDFDGSIILSPNNAMFLGSSDAATGSTYGATISWLELPI